jgi:16S rRNA G966 N2-methylase RsmD
VLVENDARSCGVIYANIAALKYEPRCRLLRGELPGALAQLRGEKFDLVFSDPPYAQHAAQATVDALTSNDLLAPAARVVLEMEKREPAPAGLPLLDDRHYGHTRVLVLGTAT